MPRQDVPYGGAICRLKERIAELWDALGKKLHSVNGVEGDAAGNVEIVSGDAAITIEEDQVNHTIEIGLDHGELPSAAVTSVNRQTGDVVLTANDIRDTDNDATVQSMINGLLFDETNLRGAINSEAQTRQAQDAVLQGNINSVQASIPGAVATAVANDPTVAQLATDVPNKLDKISSGSTLKAYTHTGTAQGETSVVDGTTANSIGIRDVNGRMQAADPASGATDKTLTTANWVSQTGAGAPNNLLHITGNETKNGKLKLSTGTTPLEVEQTGNAPAISMYALSYDLDQHATTQYYPGIYMYDVNGVRVGGLYFIQNVNGTTKIVARIRNADGTTKETTIAEGNP